MARKPKGWTDNPLGEIQKLYNAWQPNYTDPQSLAQFKETAKQVGSTGVKAADLYTTGGLGLSFAQNVIRPSSTIASKETRTAAASKGMTQFAKDVAITAASAGAGYVAGKVIGTAGREILPAEIGIHHSVTPVSGQPFKDIVKTSVANKSLTAMDQKPGYSYFWSTGKGKSGIAKAVSEAQFQTKQIADKILLDEGQAAVGYVTKTPRGLSASDTNVPGTIARELKGTQKIVNTVKGSGSDYLGMTSFSKQNLAELSKAAQVAKQKEVVKSAAKIGAVTALVAPIAAAKLSTIKKK